MKERGKNVRAGQAGLQKPFRHKRKKEKKRDPDTREKRAKI